MDNSAAHRFDRLNSTSLSSIDSRITTMPRQLKRRSEAISRDHSSADESDEEPAPQSQHRRQRRRTSSSDEEESNAASSRGSPSAAGPSSETILIKKLVRLALATEYSRTPLRRSDISAKIFKDANTSAGGRSSFAKVFAGTQVVLRDTFGMELEELPSKEKVGLKDRRTQATQTKSGAAAASSSSKSWILVSKLPTSLKTDPSLSRPTLAPNAEIEASYTALYTFILSLIYLNNGVVADQKLERYLKRVNADTYTPVGNKEKLLQRMMKEGYIDKRRDTSSGEEVIEWVPGPRGKVEVGVQGVVGLVRTVYGYGAVELSRGGNNNNRQRRRRNEDGEEDEGNEEQDVEEVGRLVKIEEDELNSKLSRSLGIKLGRAANDPDGEEEEEEEQNNRNTRDDDDAQPGPSRRRGQREQPSAAVGAGRRGGHGRRNARNDDDDDG